MIRTFLFISTLAFTNIFPQDVQWPTRLGKFFSSNFGNSGINTAKWWLVFLPHFDKFVSQNCQTLANFGKQLVNISVAFGRLLALVDQI